MTQPSPPPAPRRPGWAAQCLHVLAKDLRLERRTGEIVTTAGFFAVLIAVLVSFSFVSAEGRSEAVPGLACYAAEGHLLVTPENACFVAKGHTQVGAAVIWISVAFAAVLALGRTWHREREESALTGLLVSPLARSAVFAGKALGVLLFLFAVELLVIPTAALLFGLDLPRFAPGLALLALAATPGIAASGTLFGAMTVRTRARDLVLASVLFPLLSPTLLSAVAGTRELLAGSDLVELRDYLVLMGVFDAVFIAGGLGLFGALIEA